MLIVDRGGDPVTQGTSPPQALRPRFPLHGSLPQRLWGYMKMTATAAGFERASCGSANTNARIVETGGLSLMSGAYPLLFILLMLASCPLPLPHGFIAPHMAPHHPMQILAGRSVEFAGVPEHGWHDAILRQGDLPVLPSRSRRMDALAPVKRPCHDGHLLPAGMHEARYGRHVSTLPPFSTAHGPVTGCVRDLLVQVLPTSTSEICFLRGWPRPTESSSSSGRLVQDARAQVVHRLSPTSFEFALSYDFHIA
ncbi:hypothetical protein DFH09DRAFT_1353914 [Mycena vulgaris]|nr:hypothetical protein DFH09DRAFT_1377719 [Mycena vulgaris]KAJ6605546.1 hypothetical protein DFH09DRAFT_1353914 [Mycena vulgaris]